MIHCSELTCPSRGQGFARPAGPPDAKVLFLGEGPGWEEINANPPQPFVGATGRVVQRAASPHWGESRRANVRWCLPPKDYSKSPPSENAANKRASLPFCTSRYLHPELADLTGVEVIACVGGDALFEIMGLPATYPTVHGGAQPGIMKLFGSVWTAAEAAAIRRAARPNDPPLNLPPSVHTIIAAVHPAAAMRGARHFMPTIEEVLGRAWARVAKGPIGDRLAGLHFNLNPTPDEVRAAFDRATLEPVAVDVETRRDRREIQIACVAPDPEHVYVFDWREPFITILREALENPLNCIFGCNFQFDASAAWISSRIKLAARIFDVRYMSALVWPPVADRKMDETDSEKIDLPFHSLALTDMRLFEDEAYWKQAEEPWQQAFYNVAYGHRFAPYEFEKLYCGQDGLKTSKCGHKLKEILTALGMWPLYREVVGPYIPVMVEMEREGIRVDREEHAALIEWFTKKAEVAEAAIQEMVDEKHQARREALEGKIAELRAGEDQLYDAIPVRCPDHQDYRGRTRRAKCLGCAAVAQAVPRGEIDDLVARRKKAEAILKRIGPKFRPSSGADWAVVLFDPAPVGFGFKPVGRHKKRPGEKVGKPKLDGKNMKKLAERYPTQPLFRLKSEAASARNRISNHLGIEIDADGFTHPVYSVMTWSGRGSSGNDDWDGDKLRFSGAKNIQNPPKEIRSMYVPDRDGDVMAVADWKNIEALVVAWLAGEWEMVDLILSPTGDLHLENAVAMAAALKVKISREELMTAPYPYSATGKPWREACKPVAHGLGYGMGELRMSKENGLPIEVARALIAAYWERWPKIAARQKEMVAEVEETGVWTSPYGRRWQFHNWEWLEGGKRRLLDREELLSCDGQSVVGEMIKKIGRRLAPALRDLAWRRLLTQTHDSCTTTTPADSLGSTALLIKTTMEEPQMEMPRRGNVPFYCPVSVEWGYNWGQRHRHGEDEGCKGEGSCKKRANVNGLRKWKGEEQADEAGDRSGVGREESPARGGDQVRGGGCGGGGRTVSEAVGGDRRRAGAERE